MSGVRLGAICVVFNCITIGLAYLLSRWPVETIICGSIGSASALVTVAANLKRTNHPALNQPDDIEGKTK